MNASSRMEQHALDQGSAQWLAHRAACNNASDAGAMLGYSPYTTRSQLLQRSHTGLAPEVDTGTQRRYDDGHRTEALLRPLAEAIIGEDLYAIVGTRQWPGIERPLGASYDGLTIARDNGFECKRLNDDLRKALSEGDAADNDQARLPKHHQAQVEQQFMVCPTLERVLFGAAEFDRDGNVVDARWVWCKPNLELRAELVGGWSQFEVDLAAYVPPTGPAPQKIVAEAVEAFPSPVVQVTGQIALQDNFKVFEARLRDFLEHRLIREPKTDEDFVNLDAQIKSMKAAREALGAAEAQMLAQVQPVDQAKKTKDMLDKLLQQNVSMAEKLLSGEKERRRGEIVAGGAEALRIHVAACNTRLGKPYMPTIAADFAGVVKGLKSLTSMEDKVATELARCKIEANRVADGIDANLKVLRELANDHRFLFADTAQLVLKSEDDCRALVTARIAEHKAAEEKRQEEECARIRAEEQARADREAQERVAAERRQQEEAARATAATSVPRALTGDLTEEHYTRAVQIVRENDRASISLVQRLLAIGYNAAATLLERMEKEGVVTHPDANGVRSLIAPAANVVAMQRPTTPPAMAAAMPATLTIGAICERLGFTVTADFINRMGLEPAAMDKGRPKFTEGQFPVLCDSIVAHIRTVAHQQQAA